MSKTVCAVCNRPVKVIRGKLLQCMECLAEREQDGYDRGYREGYKAESGDVSERFQREQRRKR